MKKIIIFGFLIINSIAGFSQLSITVDSLRQRADTLWFSNRKGSIVYFRTLNDTLYFGDATGEKKVSQIGTGTGGLNFSDTISKIATKYDLTQIESGSADSNFKYMTAESARFGSSDGDSVYIDLNKIEIMNAGESFKIDASDDVTVISTTSDATNILLDTDATLSNFSFSETYGFGMIKNGGDFTYLPYGITHIPSTPHVLVTGDSANKIVQSELGSFAEDTLPRSNWNRINTDSLGLGESIVTVIPFTLFIQADSYDPVDGETTYICSTPQAPATNENNRAVLVPYNATIIGASLIMNTTAGNAGTNENISTYIRINRTTPNNLIATVGSTSGTRTFTNNALDIDVQQGDIITIMIVQPTWSTNPTSAHWSGNLFLKL